MKKLRLIMVVLALFSAFAAWAQNITVTGVVEDEEGLPVPGASVFIPGTTKGVVTTEKGLFSFVVPSGTKEIKVSCVGYEDVNLDLKASGHKDLIIVLKEATTFLESAVAVGYGSPKKVESLVGSVSTVNSESIRTAPSSSALDALQGQVAGLAVLTSGGVAGDNSVSMKLHGTGSLTSSSAPLYIIDGVPSSSRSIMALNPNDIESISILKDASATSIYGARAANGVVHIITKNGAYNNNATITVRSQYGISTITDKSLYQNMMSSAELARFWNIAGIHSEQYVKETFYDNGYNSDTKWYNYVQQFNNPQYQNDISIEGGGQRVAYLIGASQFHQRGSAIGNVYDRFTLRSNVQGRPKDWLKIGMNMSATYDKTIQNPNWSNSSDNRNYTSGALSYLTLPFYPAIDPETGKEYENEYPGGMINHHTYMANRITPTERLGLMGTAFLTIDFTPDLKFSSRAGVDGYISRYTGVMKPDYYLMGGSGWRSRSTTYNYSSSLTNTLEYNFDKRDDFKFSVLLGHEELFNDYDAWSGSVDGIINPRITLLQSGPDPDFYELAEGQSQSAFRSFFGHGDFTLNNKYIFDASVRFDASSRFGASNRWGVFWSVGGLWKAKREEFLKNIVWINDLNVKVSYGTSGNASIGDYQSLNLLDEGGLYNQKTGLYFYQPENPDLSWEKQALLTLAVTGKILDRLDFDIEWYNRKTTDMLMDVPIPATVGFSSQTRNVGALRNRGLDITLGYDFARTRDYFLHFQTTFNYNSEKVLELFDGRDRWEIANTGVAFVVGHPVMYYHPIYAGVDRNTGKPTWYVPGENIDECTMDTVTDEFSEEALTQNTGLKRHAPVNGGFSFSGAWKNFSFLMDFSYVLGKYMINNDAYFYANPNNFADNNQHKEISDFWTENNRDAKWPDWRQGVMMQFDTHLIEDASFMRLKNLQIGYSLPKSVMSALPFMKDLKITFTGRNLLTLTKYSGIDPEDDTNVSLGLPANSKQMLLGLELIF